WLYYLGGESGKLGVPFANSNYSKQSKDGKGYVNFGKIKLEPFLNLVTPTPTPKPTATPTLKPTPTPTPIPVKTVSVLNKGSFPLSIINVSDSSINFTWRDIGTAYKYTVEYFYGAANIKYSVNNTLSLSPVTAPPVNRQYKSTVNLSTKQSMHMRMKACRGINANCSFSDELFITTK
ncbi:MAG: hypothetical protein HY425_00785, partial [Candidatus Levybacteria bacterium]|nr:hypothetical protein [Candidatus Levybacteria bacterium]